MYLQEIFRKQTLLNRFVFILTTTDIIVKEPMGGEHPSLFKTASTPEVNFH